MVVSVDKAVRLDREGLLVPPEAPCEMPVASFTSWAPGRALPLGPERLETRAARWFVATCTLALTAIGTYEMYEVISPSRATGLQIVFAGLFALTFAWIAFACASSVLGFLKLLLDPRPRLELAPFDRVGRTALLMPVYNEDPARVAGTLERMGWSLAALDAHRRFDIFILSDTRDAAIAAAEEHEARQLARRLRGLVRVYYRRRENNHHRKAGNIADFVRRWGGAYDYMVVLDADSDMAADTLVTLARAMAADPRAGIIQTLPLLRNRWTLYARLQQFAGRVYGPVVAAGLASWHGRDGNYWGHNAIIRVRAFAEAAGLPELSGRKPFGGHILSHDFVEAALVRRAGWSVTMLPTLAGSYEEPPPTLPDLAARDRRWCQGNLQHAKLLTARGLHWASRVHFAQGIMSYLASPLWLLLLLTGLVLSLVAKYTPVDYFPEGFSLFPAWPVFDPARALDLALITAGVLLLPKVLGVLLALRDPELRRGCGGVSGLFASLMAETLLSALLSPVMMLIQSRFVLDVLLGRDSGWGPQNRADCEIPLGQAVRSHAWHVAAGLALAALALHVSWTTFLWFSPILAGLVLSVPVSWATGLPSLGRKAWSLGLFRIPEEHAPVAKGERILVPALPRLEAAE
jgi:membrane glycosyltransferase